MAVPLLSLTDSSRSPQCHLAIAVCLLMLLVGAASDALPKEKHDEELKALCERARAVSDLEAEGGAPFRLEANVYAHHGKNVAAGHYVRVWQSQHHWRDELTFYRYSQIRISTESAMWRRRNTNHEPLPVVQLFQGLGLNLPRNRGNEWKLTIADRQEGVSALKCVTLRRSFPMRSEPVTWEWCFDSSAGVLVRRTLSDWDTTWEYLDYTPWHGKRYPRQINVVQGGERVVEERITELVDEPNPEPALFAPPDDAEEWPRCENMRPPTITSSDPRFPVGPRGARQTLTPVWIEVGKDGHIQDAVFLRPMADPEREHGFLIDLRQRWRFQPAKCGKTPIPFAMVFEFPTQ